MVVISRDGLLRGAGTTTLLFLLLLGQEASSFVYDSSNRRAVICIRAVARAGSQWNSPAEISGNNDSIPYHDSLASDRRTMLKQIVQQSSLVAATSTAGVLVVRPGKSNAMSPEEAATAYDSYAASYNNLDGGSAASLLGISEARNQLLGQAKGHVLELAVGTGLNLDSYNPQKLSSLTLVDISDGMLKEAKARFDLLNASNGNAFQGLPVRFVKADATSRQLLELFGERSFDTVVDTFSLCVFGNEGAKKCLEQIRKVVKPENAGGRVLLLENSRSSNPFLGLYQDATADAVASMGGKGCVYNQDVERFVQGSGMVVLGQQGYAAGLFRSFVCAAP